MHFEKLNVIYLLLNHFNQSHSNSEASASWSFLYPSDNKVNLLGSGVVA